ncbi:uncharacterized protein LOC144658426 [Oculina patagonica]
MSKIHAAMEVQLQELNVKRQAYHSNSFVGNHVTTCLKFNSSSPMKEPEITVLENDIKQFIAYYRSNFAERTFPPKLHMLEDHVVPFIRKWKFPLGFFGEQGGESIHHEFKLFENTNISVKPAFERLKKMLEQHYVVNPKGRELIPQKGTRNLKRKAAEDEESSTSAST